MTLPRFGAAAPSLAARPTIYNGIQMRSRLEARFASFLDRAHFRWEYEPRAFATADVQYLPDFRVIGAGLLGDVYVEIKGAQGDPEVLMSNIERMDAIHASDPKASLACIVEQYLRPDWLKFFVMPSKDSEWGFGGLGACSCGRVHFWTEYETGRPTGFCDASPGGLILAPLHPFA